MEACIHYFAIISSSHILMPLFLFLVTTVLLFSFFGFCFVKINFETCIDSQLGKPRGIYLRQPEEVAAKQVFSINVNPKFGNADDIDLETQKRRVEFEMNVSLETSAPEWIKIPELLVLMYNGRSFKIEVDPTKLPPGLHTAHINGYDVSSKGGSAIFSVPVTVLIPLEQSNNVNLGKLTVG
jgi:tripeptidyl-peptidase-2